MTPTPDEAKESLEADAPPDQRSRPFDEPDPLSLGDEDAAPLESELAPELIPLRDRLIAARDYLAARPIEPGRDEQFEDELSEIDEALRRLAEGAYGICEYSGDPIPAARLAAQPWTRFTRESQEKLERDGRKLVVISLPADFAAGIQSP